MPGLKKWYSDLDMIGRHFVVYSESHPEVKRHYTVCNTMLPDTLNALENLADSAITPEASLNDEAPSFDEIFDTED